MIEYIPLPVYLHDRAMIIAPLVGHSPSPRGIFQYLTAIEADIPAVMEGTKGRITEAIG